MQPAKPRARQNKAKCCEHKRRCERWNLPRVEDVEQRGHDYCSACGSEYHVTPGQHVGLKEIEKRDGDDGAIEAEESFAHLRAVNAKEQAVAVLAAVPTRTAIPKSVEL
jgi:hypothetical protein